MNVLSKIKEITSGWANLVLDRFEVLDEETKKEGLRRTSICDTCPMRVSNTCDPTKTGKAVLTFWYGKEERHANQEYNGCGCNVLAKALSPNSQCPLGKWE